jgi:hypothetical protein
MMSGLSDLNELIEHLEPTLNDGVFVFVNIEDRTFAEVHKLDPVMVFREHEGLTLIVPHSLAIEHSLRFSGLFSWITLNVHSDLQAVGLTKAVSAQLSDSGISCNVVAGFYHDHIFVPLANASLAMERLRNLHPIR